MRRWPRAVFALVALGLATGAGGCGYQPPQPPQFTFTPSCLNGDAGDVALAVGGRSNQPAPVLNDTIAQLIKRAAYASKAVSVISVDGDPRKLGSETFSSNAQNDIRWLHDLDDYVKRMAAVVGAVKAAKAEADPLGAVSRAAEITPKGATVVLLDSGLQTVAPIDFRRSGLIDADPKEVATFLSDSKQLPQLKDKNLIIYGLGDVVSPQNSLSTAHRRNLEAIWKAIADESGAACFAAIPASAVGAPTSDVPAVTPIAFPPPPEPVICKTSEISDSGDTKFIGDSAEFVDPAAAATYLAGFAEKIKAGGMSVLLTGTTSSAGGDGTNGEGRIKLSLQRAEAVKAVLVGHGVDSSRITTKGVGIDFPSFVADRKNGVFDPARGALNRKVIVTTTGGSCG